MTPPPVFLTLLPLRLVSESNESRHWRWRWKRRKLQRETTYWWLRQWCPQPPALPLTITLTRISPRQLDSDNLCGSLKVVQDACADWLDNAPGKGQDRQPGLVWVYQQRRGKVREYAVEIAIAPGAEIRFNTP